MTDLSLYEYMNEYELSHNIRDISATRYRQSIRSLERWGGEAITLANICDNLVNTALLKMEIGGLASSGIHSTRTSVLAVWRSAAQDGLCKPPGRIRSVKCLKVRHTVWTAEEVSKLLKAAAKVPGHFKVILCPRAPYWESLIRTAWDSGLRRKDLHRLTPADCKPDFIWVQHKTSKPVRVRLRPSTLASIKALGRRPDAKCWPIWGADVNFSNQFRRIVLAAGIRMGPFKTLRKSCGTAVERACPGSGQYVLGNSRKMFETHYLDEMQIEAPQPPELADDDVEGGVI